MSQILIVGCGDIGTGLGLAMAADGHQCYGLRRHLNKLPAPIQGIEGDVTDRGSLEGIPEVLDYVVYTVAAPRFDDETYRAVYVQGLAHLLERLTGLARAPKRVFFVSSTAVYHQHQGEWVDENSSTEPSGFSGQRMLEAEQLLLQSALKGTGVRFSGIYGPGRTRFVDQVKKGLYCREPVFSEQNHPEQARQYSNRIHRDDCVGVLRFLIERDLEGVELDELYLASDPCPSDYADIIGWLRGELGIGAIQGKTQGGMALDQLVRTGSKRCCSQKLQALGYRFDYPSYREGFKALL